MADDIKIKLGLDAAELFAGLNKVTSELNQLQGESKQSEQALDKVGDTNFAGAAADADKLAASLDGVGEAAEGAGGILGGLQAGLTDAFSGGLIGGLVGGGLAAGVQAGVGAIVDGFGSVVDAGRGLISAQGDLQAQTGATGAEFEALKKEADEAFLGGVGESVAEATKIISNAKVVLKDALPTEQIGEFTARAQALGNLYDKDVNEVIAKSTPFIKQFGLDGDQAFNLIALAAKEGKTSQDDVLDTLAEYSQLLDEAGFSAEEFTGALVVAGQEGLFNTDKIADSIKEAQIRLKAGDTAKAFTDIKDQLPKALGDTLGNLEQLASSGQITIKEFLAKSGESIKTAFDSGQISESMASQLQVAVAGTPAEDIGVQAYNKLFGAPIPTDEITKKATEAGQAAQNAVGQYLSFDAVGRNLSLAFEKGSAVIIGAINSIASIVIPIFTDTLGPVFDQFGEAFSAVFENIFSVVKPILAAIGGIVIGTIVPAFNIAISTVTVVGEIFNSVFDAIVAAFAPLVDAVKGLFGSGGDMEQGIDIIQVFKDALGTATEIITEIGKIVADFGGLLVEFLITPIQTSIQVIANIVSAIAGWMSTNDENTESIKGTGTAASGATSFIDTLRTAFSNIRGTIGGVTEAFKVIKGVIGEFFTAISSFDLKKALDAFTGFGEKVAAGYNKGFNDKVKQANTDAAAQQVKESAEKAAKEQANADAKASAAAKTAAAKKGAAGTPPESEYKNALKLYKSYIDGVEIYRKEQIKKFEAEGLNKEEIQLKLAQDPNAAPTASSVADTITRAFKATRDAEGNLQLGVKLGKGEDKDEALLNVRKLLADADKFEVKIKTSFKLPDFKEELKGFETAVKDIEKNTEALIPKALATSQDALDENTAKISQYLDFIKSQNAEIEAAKAEALASGNIEAAESFDAQIQRNVLSINTLTSRLATYQTDSSKAIAKAEEESTLTFQLTTALQTNILDAFNSERIAKEREANEAIRAERLGALDAEEKDLTTSLAKREISFEDYAAKMADIDKARQDAMEATEITFTDRLKEVQDKTVASLLRSQSAAITGFVTDQFKDAEGNVSETGKIIGESMTSLTGQFAALAESGKATLGDFGNAAAGVAFDTVQAMIPSFVAGILGSSITALGPVFGPIAAGLATASLQLLLGQAKAALGFKDGVVSLEGPGTETSDSIPAWLSRGESVITAASTKANREELAWMNANPGMSIRDYYVSQAPQVRYAVTQDGDLIQEVRKLREETRGLGRQINRNTHVSISGELKADNNSIKAMIDSEKRRIARRG
jgi:phage-related protein